MSANIRPSHRHFSAINIPAVNIPATYLIHHSGKLDGVLWANDVVVIGGWSGYHASGESFHMAVRTKPR
jgi:hypothetical protein